MNLFDTILGDHIDTAFSIMSRKERHIGATTFMDKETQERMRPSDYKDVVRSKIFGHFIHLMIDQAEIQVHVEELDGRDVLRYSAELFYLTRTEANTVKAALAQARQKLEEAYEKIAQLQDDYTELASGRNMM